MKKQDLVRANFVVTILLLVFGPQLGLSQGGELALLILLILISPVVLWGLSMRFTRFNEFIKLYLFDYNYKFEPFLIFQALAIVAALIPSDWSYFIPLGYFLFVEIQKDPKYQAKLKMNKSAKPVTTPFEERDRFKGFPFLDEEIMMKRIPQGKFESIIIIRGGELGDVLFTTPVVRTLREKFPHSKISYITRVPEILRGNKNLDNVWDFKDPLGWYMNVLSSNWVLDFRGVIESNLQGKDKKPVLAGLSAALGAPFKNQELDYFLTFEERSWRKEFIAQNKLNQNKTVIIGGEAGAPTRTWPEEYVVELANQLAAQDMQVILLGNKANLPAKRKVIDMRGKTTFRQAAALLTVGRCYVGVDSGLLYCAIAQHVPAFGIFSVLPPRLMPVNYPEVKTIVPEGIECAPCFDEQNICKADEKFKCMKSITPEKVMAAIAEGTTKWEIKSVS